MNILAIETSCDDTGITIFQIEGNNFPPSEIKKQINLISSQTEIHRPWGGIVPSLAKREHQKNLLPLLKEALERADWLIRQESAKLSTKETKTIEEILAREPFLKEKCKEFLSTHQRPPLDCIAITQGPGLLPSLWVGMNFARTLSFYWNIPIVPVNHLEGHLLAIWLLPSPPPLSAVFPSMGLIVSGGHTQLTLSSRLGEYKVIGETRDDAAGECFDKTARLLGLGYPGGPEIAKQAEKWHNRKGKEKIPPEIQAIKLPRPMLHQPNYDFSFSGLKTAVLYLHRQQSIEIKESPFYQEKMSAEIQAAINDVLVKKTLRAARDFSAQSIILSGGVAANKNLRQQLTEKGQEQDFNFFTPPSQFCTDNAAMIALAGYYRYYKKEITDWANVSVKANLRLS
jgi:N6-L-threonylcarbamoyladenine synthase